MNNFKKRQQLFLFFFILALMLSYSLVPGTTIAANGATSKQSAKAFFLQGVISETELIDNLERFGIKCMIHEGTANPLIVQDVRPGSSAYYKGVCAGDVIQGCVQSNGLFRLTIERAGKVYQAVWQPGARFDQLNASLNQSDRKFPIAVREEEETAREEARKKTLLQYDIELIIDISGSMEFKDGTGDLTKFEWCHEQVKKLAQTLAPYQKTITITTFNGAFQTKELCMLEDVERTFTTIMPEGGTDLVDPLESRLERALLRYKSNQRPVLIGVITDGLPNVPQDPHVVNQMLIDYTQKLANANQVVVTFLQIGDTFDGCAFCLDLDDNLVNEGAKYDIVDTKTFEELKREGLVNALVDAIFEKRTTGHHGGQRSERLMRDLPSSSDAVRNADKTLNDKQDERKKLERQILGN